MELENNSLQADYAYNFVSNLTPEFFENTNELNEINVDGVRKHYYLDILAASCI